jgi:CRP-like cAMP-binding protein
MFPIATDTHRLNSLPLFAGVPSNVVARVAPSIRFEQHDEGEAIFRQGDPARWVYVVLEGFVKLVRVAPDGTETVIDVFGAGQTIGESVALTGHSFSTSGEAVTRVLLARLSSAVLNRAMRESPELSLAILAETQGKLLSLMNEIQSLKGQSADQRVAGFILSMCPAGQDACKIRLPYGKRLIAERLGLEQATLSRSFANLRAVGVRVRTRDVEIDNVAILAATSAGMIARHVIPDAVAG